MWQNNKIGYKYNKINAKLTSVKCISLSCNDYFLVTLSREFLDTNSCLMYNISLICYVFNNYILSSLPYCFGLGFDFPIFQAKYHAKTCRMAPLTAHSVFCLPRCVYFSAHRLSDDALLRLYLHSAHPHPLRCPHCISLFPPQR